MSVLAYVGLGSNLGPSMKILDLARRDIAGLNGVELLRMSPVYRSRAIEVEGPQPDFLNAVVEISTRLSAGELLRELLAIEQRHGRIRPALPNSPRTLDLDLLLHGDEVRASEALQLPHPRIQQRAFVLYPLCDLDEDIVIPGQGRVGDLREHVTEQDIEML